MKLACTQNQKFLLAVGLMLLVLVVVSFDAFNMKVSDILTGGIMTALGGMVQHFFTKDQPKTDEAVGRAIDSATGNTSSGS